jgi:hypothetical protein
MNHEPDTCLEGGPMSTYSLGPGVHGYAIQVGDEIFIPVIIAVKEGSGKVGKWLDSLSDRCVIVNCTSARLRGMLQRRGWICEWREAKGQGDDKIDHWKKKKW